MVIFFSFIIFLKIFILSIIIFLCIQVVIKINLFFHIEENMYYHQHQEARNMYALRMQMQERGNGSIDTGLVLSTDAKPRLKWTPDLHERFIEAVTQLGGADSKLMQVDALSA